MSDDVCVFGIRHHGPGCARTLLHALEAMRPDCVLIEGPAGCESLLSHLLDSELQPPVALLSHGVDDPHLAVFHPYAVFSPEWQAMQWAARAGVPIRFMDVPPAFTLEWQQRDRTVVDAATTASPESAPCGNGDDGEEHTASRDPLDWLAHAAGYDDGEAWWNHLVEERGEGEGLFEAIALAMTEVRAQAPARPGEGQEREDVREAHMRSVLRDARKAGHARIAVVCGAWHVPALADPGTAAADQRLLRGRGKLKVQTTWVPWTYRHLGAQSGYGAGVRAPGWYDHLWRSQGAQLGRVVGWYARVARLLREHDLDCSSAHLIEAARLAETLAAMRGRSAAGLDEIDEAIRSTICNGDDTPMRLIAERLTVGDVAGSVPPGVPTVPLQRDLEAQQKRLRLKAETLDRTLDLDLRNDNDLQRSHLLHRLGLLDIAWGRLSRTGHSARGTFHEVWTLAWQPGFAIDLIVASRYGQTLQAAASQCAIEQAGRTDALPALAALVDRVLLANLPDAVPPVAAALEARAVTGADPLALLAALPALANVYRYGNVRRTDSEQVAHLFDQMLLRSCIGLPLALDDLDDGPAETARETLLAADRAIDLRQGPAQTEAWHRALHAVMQAGSGTPLLRGLCARLLLDASVLSAEEVQRQLQLNLSQGAEPLPAAQWLDGFLNRNATVLLHGDAVWDLIDGWLCALTDEHFVRVVPLVRRTFAGFEAADRRDLGARVNQPGGARTAAVPLEWNEERALRAMPMLHELLGVADGT